MASIPQRELERFFAEVGPRLETAQTLDDELDRQLARRFNVFRYLRTDEMGLSRIIADLLDPAGDHGQGAAFLKLLMAKLDFASGVDLSDAKVQTERQIDGRRRIDIVVEIDSEHCLAIENKSNDAPDQEGQVKDYLNGLEKEYTHSLLIYLSPTGDGPRERSVARKTIEELTPKTFAIMPCASARISSDEFDSLRLSFSLVDWLADCRRICDVDRLRWYLREAETYCQRRYGGNLVTDSKKSAIVEFVRGTPKNLTAALAVAETWPEVAREIKSEFLKLIWDHLAWDKLPKDIVKSKGYGQRKFESYIYIYRESWRPYVVDGERRYTVVRMQADWKEDRNWAIGVSSPSASSVSEIDRARREKLHDELGKEASSITFTPPMRRQSVGWPCWEYVDEGYRDWNPLIPQMNEELRLRRGEITTYFANIFGEVARRMIPLIDDIDGR